MVSIDQEVARLSEGSPSQDPLSGSAQLLENVRYASELLDPPTIKYRSHEEFLEKCCRPGPAMFHDNYPWLKPYR